MPRPPIGSRSATLPAVKPSAANPSAAGRLDYPLGAWQSDGSFKFHSPAAAEQWNADSFLQGSHQRNWMQGRPIGAAESKLAEIGLAHSDDTYQGPDGQRYQTTLESREDPHMAMLRAAHLAAEPVKGSAIEMGQRASLKALPQALQWMAQGARAEAALPAANDNKAAANDNAAAHATGGSGTPAAPSDARPSQTARVEPAEPTKPAASSGTTEPKIRTTAELAAYNRSGHMTAAQRQAASDDVTLFYSGATAGYGDNAIAALKALGDYADGKEFGASYDAALTAEQRKTEEARARAKITGALIESLPSFIPGYGDVTGLIADLKMYREHPEERNWKNIALTAAGILPFIPSAASSIKRVGHAVEAVEDGAKAAAKEGKEAAASAGWDSILKDAESQIYTESEALKLGGEHKGLIFVNEAPPSRANARIFQDGTAGVRYDVATRKSAQPALRFQNGNPNGVNYVKFDGFERAASGIGVLLIDAKIRLPFERPEAMEELQLTMKRVRAALRQNPGYTVVYEFPDEKAMRDASEFILLNGFTSDISVRVRKP